MLAATEGSSVMAIRSTPRAFPMNANVVAKTQETSATGEPSCDRPGQPA